MWKSLSLAAAMVLACGTVYAQAVKDQPSKPTDAPAKVAEKAAKLVAGDKAPAIEVEKFLKGAPVTGYEKGKVYVVEFWATWCGPCIKSMPHISALQREYKDRGLTIVGVNIWEDAQGDTYSAETTKMVEAFVTEQGDRMGYTVAYDGASKKTDTAFMKAAGRGGIPSCFVVDGAGKVAWIGHPMWLGEVLPGVIAGETDTAKIEAKIKAAEKEVKGVFEALQSDPKEALVAWEAFEKNHKGTASAMSQGKVMILTAAGEFGKLYAFMGQQADEAIKGKDTMALNEIAWTLVDPETSLEKPDLDLALRAATSANDFSKGKDPAILDTLARVYFLKGNKAKAAEFQAKAVEIVSQDKKYEDMEAEIKARLEEYKK